MKMDQQAGKILCPREMKELHTLVLEKNDKWQKWSIVG